MTATPVLAAAAGDVLSVLAAARLPACLIGGLAVQRWGHMRATADVDLAVLTGYGDEGPTLDVLLNHFEPRHADARTFALAHRVLLLRTAAGVSIDVALAAFPFEQEAIALATTWEPIAGVRLRVCGPEHLVVYKLVAARPQDLVDVAGIVQRQGLGLDIDLIRRWGCEFAELKEEPDLLRPFEEALRKINR